MRWLLPRVASPALLQPQLDAGVLLFTTAAAILVAVLSGTAPALAASRSNVNDILKDAGRSGSPGLRSRRLQGPLVLPKSRWRSSRWLARDCSSRVSNKLRRSTLALPPKASCWPASDSRRPATTRNRPTPSASACAKISNARPGITAVSYDDSPPLGFEGGNWEPIEVQGYTPGRNENMKISRDMIAPGYFSLMKIPILEGRDFDLADTATRLHNDPDHQKVMIVNQEFARRFFAGRDPIGHKVRGWGEWFTVVGVVGNIKYRQLTESPRPFFYIPIRQVFRPEYGLTFHVRTSGPLPDAMAAVRRETAAIDPALMIFDIMPMTEYISASLYGQKIGAVLLNVLAGLGLLMAAIGLYSVMAYSVAQRTGEIGIRMALGAKPQDMISLVVRQGLGLALIGLVLGSLAAVALARLAGAALVAVSPADPMVYAGAAVFTVGIAVLSAAVPAWRALRVDPMVALRCQ